MNDWQLASAAFNALQMPNKEKTDIHIWQAPDLGAKLLRGKFSHFSYDVHTHDTACFSLLTRGAIRIRMKGQEFTARRGDLYAIEADEPHAGWPVDDEGWQLRTLYVDTAHLQSLISESVQDVRLDLKSAIIQDTKLTSMLYGVHHCSQVSGEKLLREEIYLQFAKRLLQRHTRKAMPEPANTACEATAVRAAKDFIDQSLADNVSLTDIAQAANLPNFRLYRSFEKSTGMTPHAYQRQARVRHAVAMIRARQSLSEVAAATGFADQAHLTRWFRRMMGVTPGAYQKAIQN